MNLIHTLIHRRTSWRLALVPLLAVLVTGCAADLGTELNPAPAANEVAAMEDAAVSSVAGVRVVAQSDAWTGMPEVTTEVTPVEVTIENRSDRPVRLRYDHFALVSPTGERFSALPPYGVEGTLTEPVLVEGYTPVTRPAFTSTGFEVAPYYAPAYPTLTTYADSFYYDPVYYDTYNTAWQRIALPTEEMVMRALPEGVIQPGGSVQGFVYFERVSEDVPRVRFRYDLVNARTSDTFGEISIPFTVMDS